MRASEPGGTTLGAKSLVILVVLLTAGCGSSEEQSRPPDQTTAVAREACVALWNAGSNSRVRKLLLVVGAPLRNVTVALSGGAGHSETCLITAANPDTGTAAQFIQSMEPTTYRGSTVRGNYRMFGNDTVPSGDLEESATEWNASADESGAITLDRQ